MPAAAQAKAAQEQSASIPFADHGGIWDWRSEGDSTVYFQDNHRQWYRAELFMPAFDLPFVEFIGIDALPSGTLDKFGAVYIHGQRYPFKSFVKVDGPPKKAEHGDKAKTKAEPMHRA
ncbi:MAG: hypothetical protein KGL48_10155 [Sphingomonadales bacterium]|nr:hypothetical protein [Sphingomonadales bacterium]MDE2570624.1 hypothetical protein [Sphingomonadales bacterium]